ncbi:MAG: transferrin receptor-like dimerization domain-containing protein, partial [Acidobacteriota bacterium]
QFYDRFSDGDRRYGIAMTQVMLTALMRLADADALPFEFESLSKAVVRYLDEIRSQVPPGALVDFRELQAEAARLTAAAKAYEAQVDSAVKRGGVSIAANEAIERTERASILPDGLPEREWYRNQLYAPGILTGYTAKTLPGVREAVEGKRWEEANQQAVRLAGALRAIAGQIERAGAALSPAVAGQ